MKNLYAKLFKVQQKMKTVTKDQDNPFYHSKYFDVNTVIEALRPILNEAGLTVIQPITMEGITTVIADGETGESMAWVTPIPQNPDPQKQGALYTYFRRYALTSLFLIQGELDDDANSLVTKPEQPKIDSKKCPKCKKEHFGQYPTCLDCYMAGKK